MKHINLVSISFSAFLMIWSIQSYAAGSPIESSLYYEIGGGDIVNKPLNQFAVSPSIGVQAGFKTPSLCEIWDKRHLDFSAYAKLVEDYAKGELDKLSEAIIAYLVQAPTTIVVAAIQRALPGLYDYSQNLKAQLDIEVSYAKKSCEMVVEELNAGMNPWDGWIDISTSAEWRTQMKEPAAGDDTQNILRAEKDVQENYSKKSVQWFSTERGGEGADPILLVHDITSAGYAANANATYTAGVPVVAPTTAQTINTIGGTGTAAPHLTNLWTNSDGAANFAQRVLGEKSISYCLECTGDYVKPGLGLGPEYHREYDKLVGEWTTLLAANTVIAPPTITEFDKVSSTKVRITKPIYQALVTMPDQDKNIYIYRLIADVAVDRTVEKAIALRKMLKSGINTPDVQAYVPAKEDAELLVKQLKDEIDDFTWEINTQNLLASKTAGSILAAKTIDSIRSASQTLGSSIPNDTKPIKDFRVGN